MSYYRRPTTTGATYFFTLVTYRLRSILHNEHVATGDRVVIDASWKGEEAIRSTYMDLESAWVQRKCLPYTYPFYASRKLDEIIWFLCPKIPSTPYLRPNK